MRDVNINQVSGFQDSKYNLIFIFKPRQKPLFWKNLLPENIFLIFLIVNYTSFLVLLHSRYLASQLRIKDMLIIKYSVRPTMVKKTLKLNAINYKLTKYSRLIRRSFER